MGGMCPETEPQLTVSGASSTTPRGVCERGKTISSSVSSSNSLIASCRAKDALLSAAGSIVLANLYSIAVAVGIAFEEVVEPSSVPFPMLDTLILDANTLPASRCGGIGLACIDDTRLEIDVVPSGVNGRKLDMLVLSAREFTLPAATDDSVGVIDAVRVLFELAKLVLLLDVTLLI